MLELQRPCADVVDAHDVGMLETTERPRFAEQLPARPGVRARREELQRDGAGDREIRGPYPKSAAATTQQRLDLISPPDPRLGCEPPAGEGQLRRDLSLERCDVGQGHLY